MGKGGVSMERYTYFEGGKWRIRVGDTEHSGPWVDHLAAYEDTGLEPGEVRSLRIDMAIIKAMFGDADVKRMKELCEADKEGRVVVLPCKPSGVTVYQLRGKRHALGVGVSPRHISCATIWADGGYALQHQGADDCLKEDFGKTWFLDRAEAEAALGGGGDG